MGSCERQKVTTCPDTATATCLSITSVQIIGGPEVVKQIKGCGVKENCIDASVNNGVVRTVTSSQCCDTDLCNSEESPDSSFNSPNGKQCYYCDGQSCFNRLNCLGDEDYCFKATVTAESQTFKGCISKSICDAALQVNADYLSSSCCQGNLCNSAKSVTQNLLFLLWPLFFYILIH
nr:urokinase plasminogen activator surface receptor-like [Misgurnus anguillicaudatus]